MFSTSGGCKSMWITHKNCAPWRETSMDKWNDSEKPTSGNMREKNDTHNARSWLRLGDILKKQHIFEIVTPNETMTPKPKDRFVWIGTKSLTTYTQFDCIEFHNRISRSSIDRSILKASAPKWGAHLTLRSRMSHIHCALQLELVFFLRWHNLNQNY